MKTSYMNNNYMINAVMVINKCGQYATGKTAYAMLKVRKTLQDELVPFEEAREKIFEKYGEPEEDGGWKVVKDGNEENFEKFNKELNELLSITVEVSTYTIPDEVFELNFVGDVSLYDYDLLHTLLCEDESTD